MTGLPSMINSDGIAKRSVIKFHGYNHTLGASDGDIYDMENLTSDYYPLVSPRKPRYLIRTLTKPNGMYAKDGIYYVDGTDFYKDGVLKGTVSDSIKQFAALGAYIIIFPDKKYYDTVNDSFGSMNSTFSGAGVIQDGTYVEEEAEANTIYSASTNWSSYFRVGDAVEIAGCTVHPENNKTIVIREIDGHYLRFYENSFIINEGGDTENNLTISRTVPDMDFICENENRL